jgi:hypothetical protein
MAAMKTVGFSIDQPHAESTLQSIARGVVLTSGGLTSEQLEADFKAEFDRTVMRLSSALEDTGSTGTSWRVVPQNPAIIDAKHEGPGERPADSPEIGESKALYARWRSAVETEFVHVCKSNSWIASGVLNRISMLGRDYRDLPKPIPSPKAGARDDHAQMWGPLWLSGETAVFPTQGKDPRERQRARLIGKLVEPWNRAVSLFKTLVSNTETTHE